VKLVLPVVKQRLASRKDTKRQEKQVDAIKWMIELQENTSIAVDARTVALSVLHNVWVGSAAPGVLVALVHMNLMDSFIRELN
jgi:hypothetical protein